MFNRITKMVVVAGLVSALSSAAMAGVTMEFVTVGNPENADDTHGDGYGGVGYVYEIGKYEVTARQYTEFLNAVAATDTHGLLPGERQWPEYDPHIARGGSSGSYTYSVASDWADRPVNVLGWDDAARFANWLTNGKPTGPQGLSTTEDGSYYLNGATTKEQLGGVERKTIAAGARYVIASEDEWYKAAYYDGDAGVYYDYPTGTDATPSNDLIGPDPGNNANFDQDGPTLVPYYYKTEVGEFENSESPYGTFDQGGNVAEFTDTSVPISHPWGPGRVRRGGSWRDGANTLQAAYRDSLLDLTDGNSRWGFRVVRLPAFISQPPVPDADGPYTIGEGNWLVLDASALLDPQGDYIVSYEWDLDGDGVFETGADEDGMCLLSYAELGLLGLDVGGPYDIHLKVTDTEGLSGTADSQLTIVPEPATLSLLALASLALIWRRRG